MKMYVILVNGIVQNYMYDKNRAYRRFEEFKETLMLNECVALFTVTESETFVRETYEEIK